MSSTDNTTAQDVSKADPSNASVVQATNDGRSSQEGKSQHRTDVGPIGFRVNSPHYVAVSRLWHDGTRPRNDPSASQPGSASALEYPTPMQRWQRESVQQAPWNNVTTYAVSPSNTGVSGGLKQDKGEPDGHEKTE